ncbi:MAG: hypothetical protein KJ723_09635, partial [candidate division Zixibacteria bacterium]|nr:hypothetical protein [candidate division Zixibacteria bacterium]
DRLSPQHDFGRHAKTPSHIEFIIKLDISDVANSLTNFSNVGRSVSFNSIRFPFGCFTLC